MIDISSLTKTNVTTIDLSGADESLNLDPAVVAVRVTPTGTSGCSIYAQAGGDPFATVSPPSSIIVYAAKGLYLRSLGSADTFQIEEFISGHQTPPAGFGSPDDPLDVPGLLGGWPQTVPGEIPRPVVYEPKGQYVYVSTAAANGIIAGSDSTGTGTRSNPYKTITKAFTSIGTNGDVTILVNSGVYPEASSSLKYFNLNVSFSQWISIESFTGLPEDVTITPYDNTAAQVLYITQYASCANIQFRNVTFATSTTAIPIFRMSSSNGTQKSIHFVNCGFTGAGASSPVHTIDLQGDNGIDDVQLIGCRFLPATVTGTYSPYVCRTVPVTAGVQTYTNILFYGCDVPSSANFGAWGAGMEGLNHCAFIGNRITTNSTYGIIVGQDIGAGTLFPQSNVYIGGNYVNAAGSAAHGVLVGFGSDSTCVVEFNRVKTAYQGIVFKGCNGVVARFNDVVGTSRALNGLYAKAATNCLFYCNTANLPAGNCFQENYDNVSGVKSGGNKVLGNHFIATGTAQLVLWADSSGSTGDSYSDWNTYEVRGAATWGSVRGTTISSLATMRAAWASAGLTPNEHSNDANSITVTGTSRYDLTFTAPTGEDMFCTFENSACKVFDGYGPVDKNETAVWPSMRVPETGTPGTYGIFIPPSLSQGTWRVTARRSTGAIPNAGDSIAYSSSIKP